MDRWLVIAGSLPFAVLGILHILYTFMDERTPKRIAPRDRQLIDRMRESPLGLTKGTNMWRAWTGFNLSHGLGIVVFAALAAYFAAWDVDTYRRSPALVWGAPAVAFAYVLLSWRYWFRVPLAGTLIGTICFVAAGIVIALQS